MSGQGDARRPSSSPHVVVVGGGLAGLSAAIAIADAGVRVTLVEARPRLGGMTWSFERNGRSFDNGQHVHLRCCTAYRSFLARIGTEALAPLQDHLVLPVLAPSGNDRVALAFIERSGWPAPLHLGRSILGYRHLGMLDRLRVGPAMLALRRLRLGDDALDEVSFGTFLRRHAQSEAAIARLFDLITLPTVNLPAEQASLALAAKVFKTGLLEQRGAADLGWATVPLQLLHAAPARAAIEAGGGTVLVRSEVKTIECRTSGPGAPRAVAVVLEGGVRLGADAVVLAVAHEAAQRLLPDPASTSGESTPAASGLGHSPIVNVHLVYERQVMPYGVAAALDSPVQFVFDRTLAALTPLKGTSDAISSSQARSTASGPSARAPGPDRSGLQCLSVSLSAADRWLGMAPAALISTVRTGIEELFAAARRVELLDAVVTRERRATFAGVPGTSADRPGPHTPVTNLALAGAWTDTGWPATMEGAVRSGNAAAAVALASCGRGDPASAEQGEEVVVG